MPSVFNSVLKSTIGLISGSKIRNTKTEGQNVLSLTHMANDFLFRNPQPDMCFNISFLKIFTKFTVKHLRLKLYLA